MTGLAKQAHVLAGIVVQNHTEMLLALVILFDAFDGGDLPGEHDVHYIATFTGSQAHAASDPNLDSRNLQMIKRSLLFEKLPFPLVHALSSLSGRSPRSTPCNFISCSTGMDSVRSSTWRARSSDWLISRFSSSVSVMIRKERISSISVPSNRSPALSGAI